MTKKFIVTAKEYGLSKTQKNEFLIPDLVNGSNLFIGIKSGKTAEYGMIVYTGVDLNSEVVLEKIKSNRTLNLSNESEIKKRLTSYLEQIKNVQISKIVKMDENSRLVEVDKSTLKTASN